MGVSMHTVGSLRAAGHDVVHLREEGLQRLADSAILAKAREEGRIVLTFDLDFGDLLAAGADVSPSVVLCRLANQSPAFVTPRVLRVLEECSDALGLGAIALIEDARYRIRRLPIGASH